VRAAGIVFDLDGTLVDSRRDLATAVNATRQALALAPLPVEEVTAMVGEGARTLVRRALPPEVAGEAFEGAFATFLDRYWEVCLDATEAYPGIRDALAYLAGRFPLAVLTNKPERHSRRILEGLGLAGYFETVVGGDTLASRKPDPAGLLAIALRWRVAARELVLVGDSHVDAETARAAGAEPVLVAWGFGRAGATDDGVARLTSPVDIVRAFD
jgi:phosphoglycolate phosphatase